MKLRNETPQTSFGIPEELEQKLKAEPETPKAPEEEPQKDKTDSDLIQDALGIQVTQEDFQRLLFKGYVDKEVDIVKGKLKATFHSLDVDEWQEVDELLAKEVNEVSMTKDGMDVRKGLISLSFGVTHLQGNPLSPVIKDSDGNPDRKKMSLERRKKIGAMAPSIVNLMLAKHASYTRMLDLIASESGVHLKNS